MDLSYTPSQLVFRDEVQAWLRAYVPSLPPAGTAEGFAAHREWERRLSAAGYAGLHWPREYGGRELSVVEQAIFEEEYLLAGGPERVTVVGQKLMAPTLFAHGTDEQRRMWLPGILSAEVIWSQGFSEPGAGSDLAGIRTRAVHHSDNWIVDGQKIWTSYGAFADWIFVLVRTDPDAERHRGITFLAVDMRTAGVEARPIRQIDGDAGFAEVFFTGVRVPQHNVIGDVNDGWRVAMTTLAAERDAPARPAGRYLHDLRELGRSCGDGAVARDRLGALYARALAYNCCTLRTLTRLQRGEEMGVDASVTKLEWSELERDVYETGLELLGERVSDEWLSRYWFARAATIYAGTSEIQRNVVAERLLGLPR
jgi:alkylation response protein AidB-like acyl-CoA dehydrogenase